jgi:hypothetical protein
MPLFSLYGDDLGCSNEICLFEAFFDIKFSNKKVLLLWMILKSYLKTAIVASNYSMGDRDWLALITVERYICTYTHIPTLERIEMDFKLQEIGSSLFQFFFRNRLDCFSNEVPGGRSSVCRPFSISNRD